VSDPRVVLSGNTWRVIADEIEGPDGLPRLDYLIEVTEASDRDLLGVQRWRQLTGKSAMVDWVNLSRHFLDLLLKAAGETPNAKHR
jgi:hypothetical protein